MGRDGTIRAAGSERVGNPKLIINDLPDWPLSVAG